MEGNGSSDNVASLGRSRQGADALLPLRGKAIVGDGGAPRDGMEYLGRCLGTEDRMVHERSAQRRFTKDPLRAHEALLSAPEVPQCLKNPTSRIVAVTGILLALSYCEPGCGRAASREAPPLEVGVARESELESAVPDAVRPEDSMQTRAARDSERPTAPANLPPPSELDRYDLAHPSKLVVLPPILAEVSGVAVVSDNTLAYVQDEKGAIFLLDIGDSEVRDKIRFAGPGDYEGLTYVDGLFYVLRSDGLLLKVTTSHTSSSVEKFALVASTKNHEGLGFDPVAKRLLIAAKSPPGKGKANRQRRVVYSFDLLQQAFLQRPALEFTTDDIRRFAESRGITLPRKRNKKGRDKDSLRFLPSSIAVHPITQNIYVVSAVDRTLAVLDRSGALVAFAVLDEHLFPQPEGITFQSDGTMLVTNEGQKKAATLLVFKMK